mgnify:FL=1
MALPFSGLPLCECFEVIAELVQGTAIASFYSDEAKGYDFSIGNGEMAFPHYHVTMRTIWTVKFRVLCLNS